MTMTRRIKIVVEKTREHFYVDAYIGREHVGTLAGAFGLGMDPVARVTDARVDSKFRRLGVGTALYEAAARLACAEGFPLASDFARTDYSESFWRKQVQKGRAVCVPPGRGRPAGTRIFDESEADIEGGWPCSYYVLTCPPPATLTAARRR